ncbi:hypothetical protein CEW81_18620 [Kluyvera genomosp. 3]|uniref:Mechanosensitive ion channel MscS porin domain-containing protein n=1 Tax=Kluyvera genomosp. 3 TaxID=2774055 RepID=A0A248KKQ7_9ENTR|nr:hypothetical protein CEW81_18620 [Kluyvera genomosp. 3]
MLFCAGIYPGFSPALATTHVKIMLHNIRPRATISAFFIIIVCFLFSLATAQARALNGSDIPDRADVQDQLSALNNKKDLTPQEKLVQQDLTETLQLLDKIDNVKAETAALQKQVDQAPLKLRQATDNLNALSDVDSDEETRKTLSTLSLRQLEARVSQAVDDLQNAQNDLATYNSQLVSLQTQPERVQNAMNSASQQLLQVRNSLNANTVGTGCGRPSRRCYRCRKRCSTPKLSYSVKASPAIPHCRIPCKNNVTT